MSKTKTVLGKVVLTPRGAYDENTSYETLDIIQYKGSSFIVLTPFQGILPDTSNPHVALFAQKGERGDAFTYEDFTAEQLAGLKGETGRGFTILGTYETLQELLACETEPLSGDAFAVGLEHPYTIYLYDEAIDQWVNLGPLEGPKGEDGKSTYEIAVAQGFEGTEEEWLQQLAYKSDLSGLVTDEALQEKINQLGAVTYIALITDDYEEMQALQNLRSGAIALVREEDPIGSNNYKEYIWLNPEEGWEFLGMVNTFDVEKYYTKEEVNGRTVQLSGEQEVSGRKYFKDTLYVGKEKTHSEDGNSGLVLSGDGNLELSGENPFIDFHYKKSTKDYTSRIIEKEKGLEIITSDLTLNGNQISSIYKLKNYVDQHYAVIGLVILDNTNPSLHSSAQGDITFIRQNGNAKNPLLRVSCNKLYNTSEMYMSFFVDYQFKDAFAPATFTYNGIKYGGLAILKHTSPWNYNISFSGYIKGLEKPFLVSYYDLNSRIVVNEEIYNSIQINKNDVRRSAFNFYGGLRVDDKFVATVDKTPQYGTFQTIAAGLDRELVELGTIYDLRRDIGSGSFNLVGFTGGVDGMEYKVTLRNSTTSSAIYTLPTGEKYQSDVTRWTIPAGKIGQLSVQYMLGKYILKVL